jgi:uncharacterized protein YndB with AHSA1/START domain/catechol 2,3-dioxygenase-like lactoylglutathione lyase family enzyme
MSIELDHTIVPSHHMLASAEQLAELLGVPWAAAGPGPFAPVYVSEGLTLDFIETIEPFPVSHFCFRVNDADFDAILGRIQAAGIPYRSAVRGPLDRQVNTDYGGRLVYWNEPDGHQWEMLTVSYARAPVAPQPAAPESEPAAAREFVHTRLIAAPREHVFDAISDPARLARWWGPNGFTSTFDEFDLRPGGRWRFVMHGPDGTNYANESVFVEVVAPERIVFEHLSDHHFTMSITLTARGGQTEVGWRQVFDTAAERERIAEFVVPANEQNLDRLAAEVLRGG